MASLSSSSQKSNRKNDFTQGTVSGNILKLAIPMTLAQLINVLYNVVDRMFIGRIPDVGMESLTGLGLTFPIIMIISAFTNLFGSGGAPLFSIARGEGDDEKAEQIMGNSFTLLVLAGLVLTVLGLLFKKPLLYAFGASDVTFPYANDYISIYLLGSIFVMIGLGMNQYINAQGFARIGMGTVLLGAVTNIILDFLFIFVFDMGVQGAALATVIAQALSAAWVLRFLCGSKAILRLRIKHLRLQPALVKRISALGLSSFTASCTNSLVQITYNASLQQFGGDLFVAIMTVINSVREIIMMPINGITSGSQPVLGYNYGAGRGQRVRQGIKFMIMVCLVYTGIVWALVMLLPNFFVRIFNQDPQLLSMAAPCMRLYYMGYFLMSLQMIGQSTFVALGKSKQAVFFSLFRKVVLVVPLALVLPHMFGLGVDGIFLSEPISDLIGGGACFITMMLTLWPKLKDQV